MRVTLATLAILAHVGLISATDVCAQQAKSDPTSNCNPINHPGLHEIVQGGTPYPIRWGNNTGTFVSLVLCQGNSSDIQEIDCIVNRTPNNGSYIWTPATDLVPDGNHNYGLKIIADTGDFQWSDQFGISNSVSTSSSSTAATAPTASKEAVEESAKAAKKSVKAVKQASDGQVQEPTGTLEIKEHHTKNVSNTVSHEPKTDYHESKTHTLDFTHTKSHTAKPFATGNHLSAHLVQHEKGANATHIIKQQKSQVLSSVIAATSAMESVTPTVAPSVPTTLPTTTVAPTSTLKSSFSAGGAVKVAATGVPSVLGAMAALLL